MKRKLTIAVMALLLTLGLSSVAAHADNTVTITITNPVQFISGATGGTLTYDVDIFAPLTNNADISLVGSSINGGFPLAFDTTDFINNAPFFLSPGQDSGPFEAFTVFVPTGTIPGDYSGFYEVQGGANGAQDVLSGPDGIAFTAVVTPEPSSFILLGTGLAGAFTALKRKRFSNI